ncbi:MAG: hypothetical protein ACAI25_21015 [Planctomycetota bacterium]
MRSLPHFALAVVAALIIGCSSEPEKKPAPAPTKQLLELKITSAIKRTIAVEKDGAISDVTTNAAGAVQRSAGKLKPDELKTLTEMAASVEWAKIPREGFRTANGKPVEDGREYELTYYGVSPARTVHSMDGAAEVASFTKLRDTLELHGNKIGR